MTALAGSQQISQALLSVANQEWLTAYHLSSPDSHKCFKRIKRNHFFNQLHCLAEFLDFNLHICTPKNSICPAFNDRNVTRTQSWLLVTDRRIETRDLVFAVRLDVFIFSGRLCCTHIQLFAEGFTLVPIGMQRCAHTHTHA